MKTAISDKLKWAIYDWIGSISESEIMGNHLLAEKIQDLCRILAKIGIPESKTKRRYISRYLQLKGHQK